MAVIKWKSQEVLDKEAAEQAAKQAKLDQLKNKTFGNLSTKEKDQLLELLARKAGLIQ